MTDVADPGFGSMSVDALEAELSGLQRLAGQVHARTLAVVAGMPLTDIDGAGQPEFSTGSQLSAYGDGSGRRAPKSRRSDLAKIRSLLLMAVAALFAAQMFRQAIARSGLVDLGVGFAAVLVTLVLAVIWRDL